MRCRAAVLVGLLALAGCNDSPFFPLQGDWVVTTLRDLPGDLEPVFVDLNESGQALWHEDDRTILWDNGAIREIPVGSFLGEDGEVLGSVDGTAALWRDGELTMLTGSPMGILLDGTVYLERNDTVFTWRDGTLEATDRPVGRLVGPEGRIWSSRDISNPPLTEQEECGFYQGGEWHGVFAPEICFPVMAEENAWALAGAAGGIPGGVLVIHPDAVFVITDRGSALTVNVVHVNAHGDAITANGILRNRGGERIDLWEHFDSLRTGAVNDDGEILAQFRNLVVVLTPVSG